MKRNYVDFSAPRVNEGPAGGKMLSLGLVLSRFGFNEVGTVYRRTWYTSKCSRVQQGTVPNPKPVGRYKSDTCSSAAVVDVLYFGGPPVPVS